MGIQGNFCLHANDWWNTSLPDSGPFFFRPMTTNAPGSYDEDLRPRYPCLHGTTQHRCMIETRRCQLVCRMMSPSTMRQAFNMVDLQQLTTKVGHSPSTCPTR